MVFVSCTGALRTVSTRLAIGVLCVVLVSVLVHFRFVLFDPAHDCGDTCVGAVSQALPREQIVFTFDDGPAGPATDQILDTLRAFDVPATFFLLGENIVAHPEQVRRIHAEGHVIGNHTFTHDPEVQTEEGRLVAELHRTNTLVESLIGHSAVLYRPPYLLDLEPFEVTPPKDSKPVWGWVAHAGYVPVGIDIDSDDWEVASREEALAEVRRVLDEKATRHFGFDQHVFLFHDNQATAEALPEIIALVHAYGYDVVPITTVLGLTYDTVQPQKDAPLGAALNRGMLFVLSHVYPALVVIMVMVTGLALARVVVFAVWKVTHRVRARKHPIPRQDYKGTVSVLIPAYNESENIRSTIRSVVQNTRRPDEVFVIDDGSSDNTLAIARDEAEKHDGLVRVITKENGGKASALNLGILSAHGDVLVAIDGDTVLASDCIDALVRPFAHEHVAATAGKIIPARAKTIMEKVQYLEYIVGQNIDKEVVGYVGSVNVVPGAVGAWRKRTLLEAGGYSDDTLVEDQDLTLAMLSLNRLVTYVPEARAYTEVPSTPKAFYLQRFRWVFGTFQCLYKYRRHFLSGEALRLGYIALPYGMVYNIVLPISGLVLNVSIVLGLFLGLFGGMHWFLLVLIALELVYAYVALLDEDKTARSLIWWAFPQRVIYLLLYTLIVAVVLLKVVDGSRTRWNKLARTGTADEYFHKAILVLEPRAYVPERA